jgi:hypothetical protein
MVGCAERGLIPKTGSQEIRKWEFLASRPLNSLFSGSADGALGEHALPHSDQVERVDLNALSALGTIRSNKL